MIDQQQTELVAVLAERADEAQMARDTAKDQFDIALHRSQQPNIYRWRRQATALGFASCIGFGGTLYAVDQDAPYLIPLAAGSGVGIGLVSKAWDDRRQSREKQDWLSIHRYELQRTETSLRESVTLYREEEETGWLMYALNLRKEEFLALRDWMSDPRRTMKDAILESIDIVTTHFLQEPLATDPINRLPLERRYRQLRQHLFSPEVQLQKNEFLTNVFSKHHVLRDQELLTASSQANRRTKTFSVAGGASAGLLAGSSITALGASVASTLGSSANTLASTGSLAAALGVGILAAGTLHGWMTKTETERRELESQQFHDTFMITTQILEEILNAQTLTEPAAQTQSLQQVWDRLKAFQKSELKSQDQALKQYVTLLGDRLQRYLTPTSAHPRRVNLKQILRPFFSQG